MQTTAWIVLWRARQYAIEAVNISQLLASDIISTQFFLSPRSDDNSQPIIDRVEGIINRRNVKPKARTKLHG